MVARQNLAQIWRHPWQMRRTERFFVLPSSEGAFVFCQDQQPQISTGSAMLGVENPRSEMASGVCFELRTQGLRIYASTWFLRGSLGGAYKTSYNHPERVQWSGVGILHACCFVWICYKGYRVPTTALWILLLVLFMEG